MNFREAIFRAIQALELVAKAFGALRRKHKALHSDDDPETYLRETLTHKNFQQRGGWLFELFGKDVLCS